MAKLLIFRGETRLDQRELTGQTVRIGRAPDNDLVLQDQGKGVSRNHAEIRAENGRYTLVDLGSQNGIWVSGTRVPSVVLEPGVTAALGPYRLMVEAPAAVAPAAVEPAGGADSAPIDPTQYIDRSAALLELDNLAPRPKKQETAPPSRDKSPAPVRKDTIRKERTVKEAATGRQKSSSVNARVLGGIAVLLLLAVSAAIAYKMMRKPPPPVWDDTPVKMLIASKKCQEALDTLINPALQANPSNQQALALKDECNRTLAAEKAPATTSSIPTAPTADDRLNEAEPLLQTNVAAECQKGLDIINAVVGEDANNQRAKDMAVRANACITPVTKAATTSIPAADKPAVAVPAAQGGLDVLQGETEKAYKTRMTTARSRYDDAVAVLASQKYSQAAALFTELMNDVPNGYLELQQKREEARAGVRAEAKSALTAAETAEKKGDLDTAWEQVRRARQLDVNPAVETAFQRIASRRAEQGRTRCAEGNVAKIYGQTTTAVAAFQDVVKYLQGTNDPCLATAREYLQKTPK